MGRLPFKAEASRQFDRAQGLRVFRILTQTDAGQPVEFLWSYVNVTPMGPLVAEAPPGAQQVMEHDVVDSMMPHVVDRTMRIDQPMALAWGRRGH
jgi:hypothetical protein